jgi:MFS family permease
LENLPPPEDEASARPAIGDSPVADQAAGSAAPLGAISVLAVTHFLVDISASTINPLWQGFEERFQMRHGGLLWVTAAWTISNSIAQLLFAWWADRMHQRWLLWAGAAVGIVCLSCAGFATGPWPLAVLLVTGGLGIAAFHPEAAAASGTVLPEKRSRMMAIFALAGYLGQSIGPYYSGRITTACGLPSLIWGGLILLAALALVASQQARVPIPATPRPRHAMHPRSPTPWGRWGLLLATGTLRIAPAIGVPLVIAYWLTDRELIGTAQSVFMGGIGAGSILCAVAIRPEWERTVLWLLPLAAAGLRGSLGTAAGGVHAGLHQLRPATAPRPPAGCQLDYDGRQLGHRRRRGGEDHSRIERAQQLALGVPGPRCGECGGGVAWRPAHLTALGANEGGHCERLTA